MGSLSIWHWLIVLAVALLFFGGKGKISDLMGDLAKGIKSFKKGLADEETPPPVAPVPPKTLEGRPGEPVAHQDDKSKTVG
ncbi:twin-arginine translocase TatA/TatE family subunit [Siculibacillus lacustris]|uniref:Sec-independent protein translocase protein TatA n=1 Tax=Siculibacillus lacustris TaxID=1549641 RepID=A0A4Q9VSS9_9HYPH|nr:twin-arginine translocase TatA/TatE family subunit [Siculibacillus lacustris]TBW37993.1 twin-arginine translocase TatA/TatE family subunit [Siculibacillus lacustris]